MSKLEGFEEYGAYVRHVNSGLEGRLVRKPITGSLRILTNAMRAGAPRGKRRRRRKGAATTRRLHQSHGFRFRGAKRIVAKAGVNVAKKRSQRAPHAHLVGAGTTTRRTKTGANRGRVTANDWVPRAVRAKSDEALDHAVSGIWAELSAAAARNGGSI